MSELRKALFWNSLQSLGQLVINLLSLFVLARILTPADYGVYGILMIFISLSELITDCGIGGYLIKKQKVTEIYYDTLFIFNMSVSIFLYVIIYLSAPLIADFYNNDNLISAIRILGLVIIVQAFSITQRTRLLKNLKFKAMALIVLVASFAGFVTAFVLAYRGFSFWALIWQNICFCTLSTLFYIFVNRTIPHFHFNLNVFKEQFVFGINLCASSLLQTLANNISNNVIAKIFNIRTTGLYLQANRMQYYPVSIISIIIDRTFFPILSKKNENIPELRTDVYKMQRMLYAYMMPCFTILICYAEDIIPFVLGRQWVECTPIFQILMLASYFMLVKSMNRSVLKSLGHTFNILKIEVYTTAILIAILAVAILLNNLYVLVLATVMSQCISALCSMIYLKKKAGFNISKMIVDFLTFVIASTSPCVILFFELNLWQKISLSIVAFMLSIVFCKKVGIKEYDMLLTIIARNRYR